MKKMISFLTFSTRKYDFIGIQYQKGIYFLSTT